MRTNGRKGARIQAILGSFCWYSHHKRSKGPWATIELSWGLFSLFVCFVSVVCKQALRGALAARRENEGELVTTSLEFEYLHRKSRCKMLIGANDVITLGTYLHSRSFPLRADW